MSGDINKELPGPPGPGFPGCPSWLTAAVAEPPGATADQAEQKTAERPVRNDKPTPEPLTDNDPNDWDSLDEPIDCPQCGSFDCWWDMLGGRHCKKCDPPSTSHRLRWLREKQMARLPEKRRERPLGPHCPRCCSERFVDIEIHNGQSLRRECAVCKRFIGFSAWHGMTLNSLPESAEQEGAPPSIAAMQGVLGYDVQTTEVGNLV